MPIKSNLCPGSVFYLFWVGCGDGSAALHTGKHTGSLSADELLVPRIKAALAEVVTSSNPCSLVVDTVFFDNTYCHPQFEFVPERPKVIAKIVDDLKSVWPSVVIVEVDENGVFDVDLLQSLSKALRCVLHLPSTYWSVADLCFRDVGVEWCRNFDVWRDQLTAIVDFEQQRGGGSRRSLSSSQYNSRVQACANQLTHFAKVGCIWVCGRATAAVDKCSELLGDAGRVFGILPSALNCVAASTCNNNIWRYSLSSHPYFFDLVRFLTPLQPRCLVCAEELPSVSNYGTSSTCYDGDEGLKLLMSLTGASTSVLAAGRRDPTKPQTTESNNINEYPDDDHTDEFHTPRSTEEDLLWRQGSDSQLHEHTTTMGGCTVVGLLGRPVTDSPFTDTQATDDSMIDW
eukprot:CAMPEP_0113851234 /NCGR_PEP_ID=MMETSP0372-20130328/4468_1 /TAXON_ID=340204 /ORGANISM="Lankesteria abbotti" /LENGTH=400 /DNA_ID=CAMNT_0000821903 /DNA_START=405 /DNA_END=1604 /DNA_ORIENTATION=+ /assembly_acc=CAM_ASM_000359